MNQLAQNQVPQSVEPFHRVHRNFFVGLFVIVAFMSIAVFLVLTLSKDERFQKWVTLKVRYTNTYGLDKGNAVTISGMRIGHVRQVALLNDRSIEVTLAVSRKYTHLVPKNSFARLRQKGMLVGDWEIQVGAGPVSMNTITEGDTLIPDPPQSLEGVIEEAKSLISMTNRVVTDIANGKGTVGRLITEDSIYRQIQGVLSQVRNLTRQVEHTLKVADGAIVTYQELGEKGQSAIDSVVQVVKGVEPVLEDARGLMSTVDGTVKQLPSVLTKVSGDLDELNMILRALQEHPLLRGSVKRAKAKEKGDK